MRIYSRKVVLTVCFLCLFFLVWKYTKNIGLNEIPEKTRYLQSPCLTFSWEDNQNSDRTISEEKSQMKGNALKSKTRLKPRPLSKEIYSRIDITKAAECKKKRLLVYRCGRLKCGGVGDRVKGVVSAFLLALLTNRSLVFDVSTPCEMSNFLLPNLYKWDTCLPYVRSQFKKESLDLDCGNNEWKIFQNHTYDFEISWDKRVITVFLDLFILKKLRRHWQFRQHLSWMMSQSDAEVIHAVFNTLFKPSKDIERELVALQYTLDGRNLVCSHIRTGVATVIPGVINMKTVVSNDSTMFNFLSEFDHKKTVLFIATDNDNVRKSAQKTFPNLVSSKCDIVHIDSKRIASQESNCNGMYSTLLDWFVLTTCDVYLIPYSGYGCTALLTGTSTENIFIYKLQTNTIEKKKVEEIHEFCRVF